VRSAAVSTGVASGATHHSVSACEASCMATAESAAMATAAKSAAVPSTTAATSMSTATTTVLSKGWGAHGQKRRQRTDGPQGGPITEKTVLRLHDAYSDAGFFQVAGTASRPN
jgi:acetyl-CoA acetyltransferase